MDSLSESENEIINLGLMAKDYESGEEVMPSSIKYIMVAQKHSAILTYKIVK